MALETGTQPKDLNPDWPLDTDPAQLGAAHLRLIKKILRNYFIGTFAARADLIAWYTANPNSFLNGALTIVEGRWFEILSTSAGANTTDGLDFFIVASTWRARAVSQVKQLGFVNSQNTTGLATINSLQRRRPLVRFVTVLSGTTFDAAEASAAFPNGVAVANDICIQLKAGSPSYSFCKRYNGSSWADVEISVFNTLVAFAQMSAQLVSAVSVDTDRVRTARQEVVGLTHMWVLDPEGFGPDELIQWYGDKTDLISSNGEVLYSSLTILNAISYTTKLGQTGSGGESPVPPPTPPTDATVLSNLGTLGTSYSAQNTAYGGGVSTSSITLTARTNGTFSLAFQLFSEGSPISGALLSDTTEGIGSQFEVMFEAVAEPALSGTLNTWLPITENRSINFGITAGPPSLGSSQTLSDSVVVAMKVRKTATPGVVESKAVTLNVEATSIDAIIP